MNQDFIIQICKDRKFFETIVSKFPNLYSAIVSVAQNVNAENVEYCRTKISNFYDSNEEFRELVKKFQGEGESSDKKENDVAGLILVIDKNEESYRKVIETAKKEKWQYKGISILEQFDSIRLYFY